MFFAAPISFHLSILRTRRHLMMPSRGLHWARSKAHRLVLSQSRQLSSSPQPAFRTLPRTAQAPLLRGPVLSSRASLLPLFGAASLRYASTTPSPPSAPPAAPTAPTSSATNADSSFPNLDTITLDNIDLNSTSDIANIPEQIGYLGKIGIDYGIGPTSGIQWILEHLHIYAGLPWWASIAATAVVLRVITFPFYLKSSDSMARQSALASVTKPLTDRMTAAQKAGNTAEVMMAWQQLGAIRKQAGIRLADQFTPMILQTVIGVCGFKLMRAMATLPVPGLHDGGFLWLTDLTLTDGYLLMPVLMAASVHLLIRLGGESANPNQQMPPGMKKFMMYGMPGLLGLITAFQPGAVCMWFAGSGGVGIVQSLLLQNARVRDFFGLAPMYRPAEGEASAGLLASMLDDRKQARTSATAAAAAASSGPASPREQGKNAAYMRPTYQAPVLNSRDRAGNRTIDAKLVQPGADMVQPGKQQGSGGIFSGVSKAWNEAKEKAQQQRQQDPQADYKRRAEAYEQEAQKRQR